MTPAYRTGIELIARPLHELVNRTPPPRFAVASPFERLDLRPGRLVLVGGAPGQGKTSLLVQLVVDLLRTNRQLSALIANVEMSPDSLLERTLARLSSVPLTTITDRTTTDEETERVIAAARSLVGVLRHTAVLLPPFDLRHVAAAATEFKAGVIVLDYLQRFTASGKDQREALDGAIATIRRMCDSGVLVIAAAAVARQKSKAGGSTYSDLNLASFRGSSELEFGADACYVLEGDDEFVTLRCLKNRYAEPKDVPLRFDRQCQRFEPVVP